MPRILLDASPVAIETSQRGIGRLVACLLPSLAKQFQSIGWQIVEADVRGQERIIQDAPSIEFGNRGLLRWMEPWQRQLLFSSALSKAARRVGADILLTTDTSLLSAPASGFVSASMMYDLIPLIDRKVYVDTYRRGNRWLWDHRLPRRWRNTDLVVAISHEVARTAKELLHVPAEKICVTTLGVDHIQLVDGGEAGIDTPYFLYVGAIETRKNIERLIKAFSLYRAESGGDTKLVLAGPMAGFRREMVETWARDCAVADKVVCLGRVDDARLNALYKDCLAFVFPSLLEGFGLPPLEAMRAGAPVAAAKASSLPEVLGDNALWFDGLDVQSMAAALGRIARESGLRESLREAGRAHAGQYTWDRAGETLARSLIKAIRR